MPSKTPALQPDCWSAGLSAGCCLPRGSTPSRRPTPQPDPAIESDTKELQYDKRIPYDLWKVTSDSTVVDMTDVKNPDSYTSLGYPRDQAKYWQIVLSRDLDA
jgi:hypothetical protein